MLFNRRTVGTPRTKLGPHILNNTIIMGSKFGMTKVLLLLLSDCEFDLRFRVGWGRLALR